MTEDSTAPAGTTGQGDEPRRLERVRDGRILAGVCAGLGRYTRIDPVVFRVGFALLVIATGMGILLYIAALLLMPGDSDQESIAEQTLRRRLDGDTVLALLGAVLAAGVLLNVAGDGLSGDALVIVTLLALVLLVAHSRGVDIVQVARSIPDRLQGRPPASNGHRTQTSTPTSYDQPGEQAGAQASAQPDGMVDLARLETELEEEIRSGPAPGPYGQYPATPPPAPPVRQRERSFLTPVTLFAALITAGVMIPIAGVSTAAMPAQAVVGASLAVVALGLVVGTWYGRGRGLVAAGTALSVALVATSVAGEVSTRGRIGDTSWRPLDATRTEQTYKVFAGTGRVDLTALPVSPGQRVQVRAEVSFGQMDVTVPRTARVELHARSRLGDITVDKQLTGGPNAKVDRVLEAEGRTDGNPPIIELYVRGGVGDLEVDRA